MPWKGKCDGCLDGPGPVRLSFPVNGPTQHPREQPLSMSMTAPADQQVRLHLSRDTLVRLVDLQARALAAGYRKPTYSELIQAAVSRIDPSDLGTLLEGARR